MIAHPLVLIIVALDVATLSGVVFTAWVGAQILNNWSPQAGDIKQLRLERQKEAATLAIQAQAVIFLASTLLYLIAISLVFPGIIPGAMCGTGVMQAMGQSGPRSIVLRIITLLVLYLSAVGASLDQRHPTAPLALMNGKLVLLLPPTAMLAAAATIEALFEMNTLLPVDCCAALRDTLETSRAGFTDSLSDKTLTFGAATGGALLFAATVCLHARQVYRLSSAAVLSAVAALFVPLAWLGMIRVFSAYHYEVIGHHCPWCLFLPLHYSIGYPFFGALLMILFEVGALLLSLGAAQRYPAIEVFAQLRMRRATFRIAWAILIVSLLAAGPALLWRLRFGTWL
jgi:hypothetical protein